MSDLQIGLLILGGLIVLLVFGINWWQDRRAYQLAKTRFPQGEKDALLDREAASSVHRKEPRVSSQELGQGQASALQAKPAAAAINAAEQPPATNSNLPGQEEFDEPDAAVEAVIEVIFATPVTGDLLLPFSANLRFAGNKPVRLFARTEQGLYRHRLYPTESYISLQFAVLLNNRSGALNAVEFSDLLTRIQALADQFEGATDFPEMDDVISKANLLDSTYAALDAQVSLSLIAVNGSPGWSLAQISSACAELGMRSVGEGYWIWQRLSLAPAFTLSCDSTPQDTPAILRLTALLDVPRTHPQQHMFSSMSQALQQLAQNLNAQVVDDNGKPVSEPAAQAVDQYLDALQLKLLEHNLPAGSARALRVFS